MTGEPMRRSLKLLIPALVLLVLFGCSNPSTTHAAAATQSQPARPSAATAAGWAAKWCDANLYMTRAELTTLMGTPTSSDGDQSDSWYAYQWGFNAFYGSDGSIRSLEIGGQPSAAEKAAFTCDEIRRPPA